MHWRFSHRHKAAEPSLAMFDSGQRDDARVPWLKYCLVYDNSPPNFPFKIDYPYPSTLTRRMDNVYAKLVAKRFLRD